MYKFFLLGASMI